MTLQETLGLVKIKVPYSINPTNHPSPYDILSIPALMQLGPHSLNPKGDDVGVCWIKGTIIGVTNVIDATHLEPEIFGDMGEDWMADMGGFS